MLKPHDIPKIRVADSPNPENVFYASGDVFVDSNGIIYVKFSEFGPSAHKDGQNHWDRSHFYKSEDGGETFSFIQTYDGFFWGFFMPDLDDGLIRLFGNTTSKGDIVLLESSDGLESIGITVLFSGDDDYFSNQETAYLVDDGKIYIATVTDDTSNVHEELCMMYADLDSDLSDPESWTRSPTIERVESEKSSIWGDDWFINEPNVIKLPSGQIEVRCRVDSYPAQTNKQNVHVIYTWDGLNLAFSRYEAFDGGYVKMQIKRDLVTGDYFCARNSDPIADGRNRRTLLVLDRSTDCVYWRRAAILMEDDPALYASAGSQYPSIFLDNVGDLHGVIRRSDPGIADDFHNANTILYFKIENFRKY
jgi:hypothetical protein